MSRESENNALRIPNYGIYGGEWLTSCFNASCFLNGVSGTHYIRDFIRSMDQFGRGSRHRNVPVTTVDHRLPLRIQSLYSDISANE
jgi:hypothetical protein